MVMAHPIRKDYDPNFEDIRRYLLRFRTDPKFRGAGGRVPLRQFAELCGISRQMLYNLIHRDIKIGLQPVTRDRLLDGLAVVVDAGLRWHRRDRNWVAHMPDGSPPPPPRQLENLRHGHQNL